MCRSKANPVPAPLGACKRDRWKSATRKSGYERMLDKRSLSAGTVRGDSQVLDKTEKIVRIDGLRQMGIDIQLLCNLCGIVVGRNENDGNCPQFWRGQLRFAEHPAVHDGHH